MTPARHVLALLCGFVVGSVLNLSEPATIAVCVIGVVLLPVLVRADVRRSER